MKTARQLSDRLVWYVYAQIILGLVIGTLAYECAKKDGTASDVYGIITGIAIMIFSGLLVTTIRVSALMIRAAFREEDAKLADRPTSHTSH